MPNDPKASAIKQSNLNTEVQKLSGDAKFAKDS